MAKASSRSGERSFVERSLNWWDGAYSVIISATLLAWALLPEIDAGRRVLAIALLGVGVLAYLLVGRRQATRQDWTSLPLAALGYILLVCALALTLIRLADFNHLLLFVVFPQIWMTLPTRPAVLASSALTGVIVAGPVAEAGWSATALTAGLVTGITTAGLGVFLGLWITRIVTESEQRRELIAELERTRAELADAHRREGVLAERERLAVEIHDTLAQGFMSILMLSQATETPGSMSRIERTARENLAEARSLIEALGPTELRSGTLAEACARVVEHWDCDIGASFRLEGEPRTLPANSEVVLLRATQEALANVAKHAQADHVNVLLAYTDDRASVLVTDDGRGFEPVTADGFGLRGMRHRVEQVNGTLAVESGPGRGTTVRVEVR